MKTLGELLTNVLSRTPITREQQQADEERRARAQQRSLAELADSRGVPSQRAIRAHALRPELDGDCLRAVRGLLEWDRKRGEGGVLWLAGDPGCGKTVAASWAVAHYTPAPRRTPHRVIGCAARMEYASEFSRIAAAKYGDEAEKAELLRSAKLLVLDEAGVEHDPNAIAELLIRRIADERLTLLTTNLSKDEIQARYCTAGTGAGRLLSRLAAQEIAGLPWVHWCNDGDRRLGL